VPKIDPVVNLEEKTLRNDFPIDSGAVQTGGVPIKGIDLLKKLGRNAFALAICAMVALISVVGAGCIGEEESDMTVTIGTGNWADQLASRNVLKLAYEQAGYEVEFMTVDLGPVYQGLAQGDIDLSWGWWPVTQSTYMMEYYGERPDGPFDTEEPEAARIDFVSTSYVNAKCGLVVPKYVYDAGVTSIEDLNEYVDEFGGKIAGIDAGAGIMQNTAEAIDEYDLNFELMESSGAAMTAALQDACASGEWIVVTGWSPHWMFVAMDLKYLEDPEKVYGEAEYVANLARLGFQEDNPGAYGILERFNWTVDDVSQVMHYNHEGMSWEEAAQVWVNDNQDMVDQWIAGYELG